MKPILIATTNPGKFKEFIDDFKDLPYKFVNLKDVGLENSDVDEPYESTAQNAIHKAKWYAEKTKLVSIAEDTGFYVKALRGAPGVKAKRFAPTVQERNEKILLGLKMIPTAKRGAYFETHACLYNPNTKALAVFEGRVDGVITKKIGTPPSEGMTYDSIFFHIPSNKLFADMTTEEKNLISHRGKTMSQLRFYLEKMFGFKQIVAPVALIIKNRRLLLTSRRDSRPEFNKKWEFPGGGVERGESVEQCLRREVNEETGLDVKIIKQVMGIPTRYESRWNYQVFLLAFICSIKSGIFKLNKNENHGHCWFTYDEAMNDKNLLPLNKKIIQDNKILLKKYID